MNLAVVAATALFLGFTAATPVTADPVTEAVSLDLPPNHGGCDYLHWHHGDLLEGTPPSYHYHPCM
jgi:hypothetical protein